MTLRGYLAARYPVAPSIEPHFQERALRAHGVSSSRFDDETAHGRFAAQSDRRSSTLQCQLMTQSGRSLCLAVPYAGEQELSFRGLFKCLMRHWALAIDLGQ